MLDPCSFLSPFCAVLCVSFRCLQTLAAYDSDEWGELEEDDDRVQGQW